jgi:hypothetical protein
MRLGDDEAEVQAGDRVTIPPGAAHKLWAGPDAPLALLCGCAPPYSDETRRCSRDRRRGSTRRPSQTQATGDYTAPPHPTAPLPSTRLLLPRAG